MWTDYVLGVLTFVWATRLAFRIEQPRQRSVQLWASGFFVLSIASFTGGTFHGFALHLSKDVLRALWMITIHLIDSSSMFWLVGALYASLRVPARRWWIVAAVIKFVILNGLMHFHDEIRCLIYDSAPNMIGLAALQIYERRNAKSRAAWILGGIAISFVAAGIQQSGLTLHENFNHNDLYHVVQMAGLYLMYRGGLLLRDRPAQ